MKLDPSTIAANLSAAAAAEAEAAAAASQNNSSNMPMLLTSSSSSTVSTSSSMAMASIAATTGGGTISNQSSINSSSLLSNSNPSSSITNSSQQSATIVTNMAQHHHHNHNHHHHHHHSTQQPTSTSQLNQATGTNSMTNNSSGSSSMANKITPKDSQVVAAILKEMGINEFEPRVLPQLVEFAYRYVARVLEDAQLFSSYARKKVIDTDDVSLAIQMQIDRSFVGPPSRDILLEISRNKNTQPLPPIKSHNGMRLPADRYSLVAPNFRLISKPINTTTIVNNNQNQNNNNNAKSINKTVVRTVSSSLLSNTSTGAGSSSSSFMNSKISLHSPVMASPTAAGANQNIQQQQHQTKNSIMESVFGKRKLDDI
ncbi:TBP-associated factor 9 [Dermatophagoides farinae]